MAFYSRSSAPDPRPKLKTEIESTDPDKQAIAVVVAYDILSIMQVEEE